MSKALAKATEPTDLPATIRCAHCGLETSVLHTETWALQDDASSDSRSSQTRKYFCCRGCMGAYSLIHQLGLENFYSLRSLSTQETQPVVKTHASEILKNLDASGIAVEALSDGTCRVRLGVEGLHCAACSWLIESLPPSIPGLKSAHVRMSDTSLELLYDPSRTDPFRVAESLAKFGYWLGPLGQQEVDDQTDRRLRREHWIWIAVAFFLAANAMWIGISLYAGESTGMAPEHERFLRWIGAILGVLSAVLPGRIFFRSAWQSIKNRVPHVDVPVAIGLLVGTVGSVVGAATGRGQVYFDSLASLVFLLRVGRYIQFRAQFRSGMSIAKLLRFHDVQAVRLEPGGDRVTVPANRLQPGDRVMVRAGGIVPADGIVADGHTELQTAFITGESRPLKVHEGDSVIGGSLNLLSPVELTVSKAVQDGRLGRLAALVQQATADRTPLIQLADRVGRVFVWVVLGFAALTFLVWWNLQGIDIAIERMVALLTIACPCALALAAPLVITVAIGRAAKERIWIRDGNALERLARPGLMCFDKTGTLTFGDMRVIQWSGPEELLPAIAAIESQFEHPISRALVEFSEANRLFGCEVRKTDNVLCASDVRMEIGRGVYGTVDGKRIFIGRSLEDACDNDSARRVDVIVDGQAIGWFRLGDVVRPNLLKTMKSITERGWRLAILSGDDSPQVQKIADDFRSEGIGLVDCKWGLSPEQKCECLVRFKEQGFTTAMVGDGINDALALATADVGIAVRGPSEIALKNAPIYIGKDHLEFIPRLLDAASNSVWAIYRCFAASLLYNCITIGLAATGYIHPLIAAVFMPISGITVLLMAWSARTFPSPNRNRS